MAVGDGDQLLLAVRAHPDDDQRAYPVGGQPNVEVDAVPPDVDVVCPRQVPVGEAAGLLLPGQGQPGDHRRGQPGHGADHRIDDPGHIQALQHRPHCGQVPETLVLGAERGPLVSGVCDDLRNGQL